MAHALLQLQGRHTRAFLSRVSHLSVALHKKVNEAQGTSLRASVPYQIDMASSSDLKENGLVVTLMRPAEQHARLLSYTFDVVNADDTTSYTLDELLDQAHQLID